MLAITIFTPTYNRATLLPRLFHSLQHQTNAVYEWIIVDDGSTDATREVVAEFTAQASFPVRYFFQENKGKHFAINRGVREARGDYFFIVDSDDMLPPDALRKVSEMIVKIDNRTDIGGVSGRCQLAGGEMVGHFDRAFLVANALDVRFVQGVTGDLAEVFKTAVLREFPFPEIENEKFCPEALVWNRIAQKYKLIYFNQPIYEAEYQPEGLTDRIVKIRMTSPIASMMTYSELASYNIPFREKIKASINFWRFSFTSHLPFLQKITMVGWPALLLLPVGALLYYRDKNNNKTTI